MTAKDDTQDILVALKERISPIDRIKSRFIRHKRKHAPLAIEPTFPKRADEDDAEESALDFERLMWRNQHKGPAWATPRKPQTLRCRLASNPQAIGGVTYFGVRPQNNRPKLIRTKTPKPAPAAQTQKTTTTTTTSHHSGSERVEGPDEQQRKEVEEYMQLEEECLVTGEQAVKLHAKHLPDTKLSVLSKAFQSEGSGSDTGGSENEIEALLPVAPSTGNDPERSRSGRRVVLPSKWNNEFEMVVRGTRGRMRGAPDSQRLKRMRGGMRRKRGRGGASPDDRYTRKFWDTLTQIPIGGEDVGRAATTSANLAASGNNSSGSNNTSGVNNTGSKGAPAATEDLATDSGSETDVKEEEEPKTEGAPQLEPLKLSSSETDENEKASGGSGSASEAEEQSGSRTDHGSGVEEVEKVVVDRKPAKRKPARRHKKPARRFTPAKRKPAKRNEPLRLQYILRVDSSQEESSGDDEGDGKDDEVESAKSHSNSSASEQPEAEEQSNSGAASSSEEEEEVEVSGRTRQKNQPVAKQAPLRRTSRQSKASNSKKTADAIRAPNRRQPKRKRADTSSPSPAPVTPNTRSTRGTNPRRTGKRAKVVEEAEEEDSSSSSAPPEPPAAPPTKRRARKSGIRFTRRPQRSTGAVSRNKRK
eukprot:c13127_g1_i2.p1 GENE.c13127_g1_i2~~c13127_g1_i2.p1  ORF type:complete len:751 (+),score=167.72 c13127_g1_i2:319-2253(+)